MNGRWKKWFAGLRRSANVRGKANIEFLFKFIHKIAKDKTNILSGHVGDEFGFFEHRAKNI